MVANNLSQAQSDLETIVKRQPKMGTDIDEYQEAKVAWQADVDAAQRRVDYWQQVQQEQVNKKAAAAKSGTAAKTAKKTAAAKSETSAKTAKKTTSSKKNNK